MNRTRNIEIAYTWDGRPLAPADCASLRVRLGDDALLIEVDAPFAGDPAPAGPPGPTPRLWESEVVELFLLGPGESYIEIEIGPLGHHLVLRLEGVRAVRDQLLPLDVRVDDAARASGRFCAVARIAVDLLPAPILAFNAYRVSGPAADRQYHAHAPVPGPHADFHRLQYFPSW